MEKDMSDFIDKLISRRIEVGMTLSELSELTGISVSYLSLLENKKRQNPNIEKLNKITEVLDIEGLLKNYKENMGFIQYLYPQGSNLSSPTTAEEKIEYLKSRLLVHRNTQKFEPEDMIYIMQIINDIIKGK